MTTEGGFYPRPTRGRSRADDVDAKSTAERALTRRGLSPASQQNRSNINPTNSPSTPLTRARDARGRAETVALDDKNIHSSH